MNKSELKQRYSQLVGQGKLEEAQKVLREVHAYKHGKEEPTLIRPVKIEKLEPVKKKEQEESKVTLDDLAKIKGIGKKTILDLKRIYHSIPELVIAIENDKVPLRDDYVVKIKQFIGGKQ